MIEAIWRTASARSASRSFMSGLLGGHPRRCPLRGRAPSGGVSTRSVSASVHYIRMERGSCLTRGRRFRAGVNQRGETETETQRTCAETGWNRGGVGEPTPVGSNGETNGDAKFCKRLRGRAGRCHQPTGTRIIGREGIGSSGRTRTYNPSVNSSASPSKDSYLLYRQRSPHLALSC